MMDVCKIGNKTGDDAERAIARYLEDHAMPVRVAGSGSVDRPAPDVMWSSLRNGRYCGEVKTTTSPDRAIYIDKQEVKELEAFSQVWDAEPVIIVNTGQVRKPRVVSIYSLNKASERRYKITQSRAHKGTPLDHFVGDEV